MKIRKLLIAGILAVLNAGMAADNEVNYALSKNGGIISECSGGNAVKVIDGDLKNYWGAGPYPQHFTVRMLEPVEIDQVKIYFFEGRTYKYKVEYSVDGNEWQLLADHTEDGGRDLVAFPIKPTLMRFCRLTVTHNSANPAVHVRELELWGKSGQGGTDDAGKIRIEKASASSEETKHRSFAAKAFDWEIDGSGYWCSAFKSRPPQWIEGDFGKLQQFDTIKLYLVTLRNGDGLLDDFSIEYFNEEKWHQLKEFKGHKDNLPDWATKPAETAKRNLSVVMLKFPQVTAEKIRLNITRSSSALCRVCELEVSDSTKIKPAALQNEQYPAGSFRFDFGPEDSALQPGYTRITTNTVYNERSGYGFVQNTGLIFGDRLGSNALDRDFIAGTSKTVFKLKVPKGLYRILVRSGDVDYQVPEFQIYAQGKLQVPHAGTMKFEDIISHEFEVQADGKGIELAFDGPTTWVVNGLLVYPVTELEAYRKEEERLSIDLGAPKRQGRFTLIPSTDTQNFTTEFTVQEKKDGYVLFAPCPLERVMDDRIPARKEIVSTLKLDGTPGERMVTSFALHTLQLQKHVEVAASEFIGPDGSKIPAPWVRRIKIWPQMAGAMGSHNTFQYQRTPELLMPNRPWSVRAEKTQQYFLSFHIPEQAKPGVYRSSVTVTPQGGPVRQMEVLVTVHDFKLRQHPNFFASASYSIFERGDDEIKADFKNMAEHGMNGVVLFSFPQLWKQLNGKRVHDMSQIERILGYAIETWPGLPLIVTLDPPRAKLLYKLAREKNYPPIYHYPVDEPFSKEKQEDAKKIFADLRKSCPDMKFQTTITIQAGEALKDFLADGICTFAMTNVFPETNIPFCRSINAKYFFYSNGCREYFAPARFRSGFFFWKSGLEGQWYFAGYPIRNAWNDLDGRGEGKDWCLFYPMPGGPIDTIQYESMSAGWNDYRYAYTLEQLIAKAGELGKSGEALDRARSYLEELRKDVINDLKQYKKDEIVLSSKWENERYDRERLNLITHINALFKAIPELK